MAEVEWVVLRRVCKSRESSQPRSSISFAPGFDFSVELFTLGFELGDLFTKAVDRGAGTSQCSFEIRARQFLGHLSSIVESLLSSGPALGSGLVFEFIEGELAVLARAVGSEVGLVAVLVGLSGSSPGSGVEPRESVCGHGAVCGHRTSDETSAAECRGSLRGNL